MHDSTRRTVLKGAGAAGIAGLLGTGSAAATAERLSNAKRANQQVAVRTRQSAGNSVHWILPGPRRIDPHVFGTPEAGPSSPQRGDDHIAHKIWYYQQHRPGVVGLLAGDGTHDPLPLPVGLPNGARKTNATGTRYTETAIPVPFSDKTVGSDAAPALDGAIDLTYIDRSGFEGHGSGGDEVDLEVWLTDPSGTRYEFDIHHLETHDGAHLHGRGVMTGVYMHGTVPIGTPLMPTQYAFGSFWAVGDLLVDGEVTDERNRDRVIHVMTTQNVRTADYELAIDEELPLGEHGNPDPYLGSEAVTHVFLPPIKQTDDGPRKVGLQTGFELPNGTPQPFLHVMFDEATAELERAAKPP
jgi:hypothetical protein